MSTESAGGISFDIELDLEGIKTSISQAGTKIQKEFTGAFQEVGQRCQEACNSAWKTVGKTGSQIEKEVSETQKKVQAILNQSDLDLKSKAAKIAWVYRKEGMNASDAMKKAWAEIERGSSQSGKKTEKSVKGITKQVKETKNSVEDLSAEFGNLSSVAKKIAIALLSAFSVRELLSFTSECLELGSALQEVQNVVDVTFPKMSAQVNSFAKSAIASFGLSETMAKQFTGTFGAMAKAFGYAESEAYGMATTLTGLAGDVASFYNLTQEEAYTKLKSVFTGETESLKDLGVVMTQTALDAFALEKGFGKTTAKMSEMEKVALRYQFVQEKLSAATGDFMRTSDSWANQTRVLKLQFDSLKASLGQGFINVLTPVIKIINTLMSKLIVSAELFKGFTELLTGKTGKSQVGAIAEEAQAAEQALNGVTTAAEEAKKAAETSEIDELNLLSQSDNTSDLSVNSDIDIDLGTLAEGETMMEQYDQRMGELLEKIEPVEKAFKSLLDNALTPMGEFAGNNLTSFYEEFLKPVGEWSLEEGLPGLAEVLENLVSDIDWDNLAESAKKLYEAFSDFGIGFGQGFLDFLSSASEYVGEGLAAFIDGVAGAVSWICDNVDSEILEGVGTALGTFAGALLTFKIVTGLAGWITGLGTALGAFATSELGGVALLTSLGLALASLAGYADDEFMKEYKQGIEDAVQSAEDAINAYDADMSRIEFDYERINSLLADYYTLSNADYGLMSDEDKAKLKEYYDAIVAYCPEINSQINSMTGAYTGTREELQKLIDKQHEMYAISATESALEELMKESFDLEYDLYNTNQLFEEAKNKLIALMEAAQDSGEWTKEDIELLKGLTLEDLIRDFNVLNGVFTETSTFWERIFDKLAPKTVGEIRELKYTMEECGKGAKTLTEEQERMNDKIDFAQESLLKLTGQFKTTGSETEVYTEKVQESGNRIKEKFKGMASSAKESMNNIKSTFSSAVTSLRNSLQSIVEKSDDAGGKFKSSMNGMAQALSELDSTASQKSTSIGALVSDMALSIDSAIAKAKTSLSSVSGSTEVSIDASVKKSINAIALPRLASGGYVRANTPQLAMIGDNLHQGEVVAPEDKLLEMAKLAAEMSNTSSGKNEGFILQCIELLRQIIELLKEQQTIEVDGKVLGNTVRKVNREYYQTTGKSMFEF